MALTIPRLGVIYTRDKILEEVQVLTGELDPEVVPNISIQNHIEFCTFEVVSLLNQLCAPWYGFLLPATLGTGDGTPCGASTNSTEAAITINGLAAITSSIGYQIGAEFNTAITTNPMPFVERITAVISTGATATGTCKRAKDFSQYNGIVFGNNTQWANSIVWFQIGNEIRLWYNAASPPTILVAGFRQHVPMIADGTCIDLPDKYVPLVISKVALWAMKQAKVGNVEKLESSVDQSILQLQREYDGYNANQIARSRNESVEGI